MLITATMKFKHGYMTEFFNKYHFTIKAFAEMAGLNQCAVGAFVNFKYKKLPPPKIQESIFNLVKKYDAGVTHEDLFGQYEEALTVFGSPKKTTRFIDLSDYLTYSEHLQIENTMIDLDDKIDDLKIKKAIEETLDEVELFIIKKRYYEDLSFKEIATEMGVTLERIMKIHHNALRSLRFSRYPKLLSLQRNPF